MLLGLRSVKSQWLAMAILSPLNRSVSLFKSASEIAAISEALLNKETLRFKGERILIASNCAFILRSPSDNHPLSAEFTCDLTHARGAQERERERDIYIYMYRYSEIERERDSEIVR